MSDKKEQRKQLDESRKGWLDNSYKEADSKRCHLSAVSHLEKTGRALPPEVKRDYRDRLDEKFGKNK